MKTSIFTEEHCWCRMEVQKQWLCRYLFWISKYMWNLQPLKSMLCIVWNADAFAMLACCQNSSSLASGYFSPDILWILWIQTYYFFQILLYHMLLGCIWMHTFLSRYLFWITANKLSEVLLYLDVDVLPTRLLFSGY